MELTQEDLYKYRDLKDIIKAKCIEIISVFGNMNGIDSIDSFDLSFKDNKLKIVIEWSCRSIKGTWYPIDYLFKTKEELEAIKKKAYKKAKQEESKLKKKLEQTEKRKRRREYLKLKRNYLKLKEEFERGK